MTALAALAAAHRATAAGRALDARMTYRSLLELSNLLSDAVGDLHNVLVSDALTDDEGNLVVGATLPRAVAQTGALGEVGRCAALLDEIRARLEAAQ